jgi:hypothetical protein
MADAIQKSGDLAEDSPEAQSGATIEGGVVEGFKDIEVKSRRVREATARTIALALIWILGISAALHYIAIFALELNDKTAGVEELNRVFNIWFPVVSGLVGSATTYYFTKERS